MLNVPNTLSEPNGQNVKSQTKYRILDRIKLVKPLQVDGLGLCCSAGCAAEFIGVPKRQFMGHVDLWERFQIRHCITAGGHYRFQIASLKKAFRPYRKALGMPR